MDSHVFHSLEHNVDKLFDQLKRSTERQTQLSAALVKSREEIERLRTEIQRLKSERTDPRKKVDALLRDFESLELRFDGAEQ